MFTSTPRYSSQRWKFIQISRFDIAGHDIWQDLKLVQFLLRIHDGDSVHQVVDLGLDAPLHDVVIHPWTKGKVNTIYNSGQSCKASTIVNYDSSVVI